MTARSKAAQTHAKVAMETLAVLMRDASSESVRLAAANALLDRAHGKASSRAVTDNTDSKRKPQPISIEVRFVRPEVPAADAGRLDQG